MAIVKIWNDHDREHVEMFKQVEYRIPAGGFIEMDYLEAVDLAGQFFGMRMLGPNNPDPACFKKLRVEEPKESIIKEDAHILHATGKTFSSPAEVMATARALALLNPSLVAADAGLDERAAATDKSADLKAENEKLKAQIAALQSSKKPGPKPKLKAQA